jgi:hypothetical protein
MMRKFHNGDIVTFKQGQKSLLFYEVVFEGYFSTPLTHTYEVRLRSLKTGKKLRPYYKEKVLKLTDVKTIAQIKVGRANKDA